MISDELTVPRYRTEKPSKSPPPPPPRRSFPSSPGLTSRSGEPLIPGKSIKVTQWKHKCIFSVIILYTHRILLNMDCTILTTFNKWLTHKGVFLTNQFNHFFRRFRCVKSLFCVWRHRSLNLKKRKARSLMWNWGGLCLKILVLHLHPPLLPPRTRTKERRRKQLPIWR